MRHFEELCRARGTPLTVHRRTMLEVMLDRKDHPTADQAYEEMRGRLPGISRTSVYRILDMLAGAGMITKVCHPGSAARFDPTIHQHHHLVCLRCERIIDVEEPRLNHVPWPDVRSHGFQINDYHIHFCGTCAECLQEQNVKPRTTRSVGRPRAGSKAISIRNNRKKERKRP